MLPEHHLHLYFPNARYRKKAVFPELFFSKELFHCFLCTLYVFEYGIVSKQNFDQICFVITLKLNNKPLTALVFICILKVTAEFIIDALVAQYSANGSSKRNKEISIMGFFNRLLEELEDQGDNYFL